MNGDISIQYCDSNSILVINIRGQIKRLYTPFKVESIEDVGRFKTGSVVYVDEVAAGERDELIYFISTGAYYHRHFRILASF